MSGKEPAPLLVACLCAAWCRTCGDYRSTFDALQAEFSASAQFMWVDIEDDEHVLDEVDVVDFPTLLLAHGEAIDFYGPVLPNPQAARQLIERALKGQLNAVRDPLLAGLPARIAALR